MHKLTRNAVQKLEALPPSLYFTLYMSTHNNAAPPNIRESQTYFKNLCSKAADKALNELNADKEAVQNITGQLDKLYDDLEFWSGQADGLVVIAGENICEYYNLTLTCDEYVTVGDRPYFLPLISLLPILVDYYVLSVSQKDPVLFRGDAYGLELTDIDLPKNIRNALNIDEMVQEREGTQFHSVTSSGTGAMWHGHGGAKDAGEQERLDFYKLVDDLLRKDTDNTLPLILAGTESEVEDFRRLSSYPHILDGSVHGSFRDAKPEKLFPHAWAIMEQEVIQRERQAELDRYLNMNKLASSDEETIFKAAEEGRIDTLLLPLLRYTTDNSQDNLDSKPKLTFLSEDNMARVSDIAMQTFDKSGKVILIDEARMSPQNKLGAIFRF